MSFLFRFIINTSQNYYKWQISSVFRLYSLNYTGFLCIGLGMTKIFSSIPPFLCKSSMVRKWEPVFDGHFVHDQISDFKTSLLLSFHIQPNLSLVMSFLSFEALKSSYQESNFCAERTFLTPFT